MAYYFDFTIKILSLPQNQNLRIIQYLYEIYSLARPYQTIGFSVFNNRNVCDCGVKIFYFEWYFSSVFLRLETAGMGEQKTQ